MHRFKHISHRNTWCQLKRLESSLPASGTLVKLPTRINREPTDVLKALESTIGDDAVKTNYPYHYHDDPFFVPKRKLEFRIFPLSYESGKKTAMWIRKEHQDLFPKHLSEPAIKAFAIPVTCKDKDQLSEEILLHAISEHRISDAIDVYKALGASNVSNRAKQTLLELLCFYNDESSVSKDFPFEHYYTYRRDKLVWRYNSEAQELYRFLKTQDSTTAVAAHNAMLCALTKHFQIKEGWGLYEGCKREHVPFNVTTYNHILLLISRRHNKSKTGQMYLLLDVLTSMNREGVKPNVRTLNTALEVVMTASIQNAKDIVKFLLMAFRKLNIEFSLATYYYALNVLAQNDNESYKDFVDIITAIEKRSFAIQDPMDTKFFSRAMHLANYYTDKKIGDTIHALLLTGNTKFLADSQSSEAYYRSYILLLLATSTLNDFFQAYGNLVPREYVPDKIFFMRVLNEIAVYSPTDVAPYLPKLWSDIRTYIPRSIEVETDLLSLIQMDNLPADSPLRTTFAEGAWNCWNDVKNFIEEKPEIYNPIETATIGYIVSILLHNAQIEESTEILTRMVNEPNLFIPTMSKKQVEELFELCILRNSIPAAIRLLEYCANSGFSKTADMAKRLNDALDLSDAERNKLGDLLGVELPSRNTPMSS